LYVNYFLLIPVENSLQQLLSPSRIIRSSRARALMQIRKLVVKLFLIDPYNHYIDFALRCMAQGHEVRYFLGPRDGGERSPVGDGLVHKVPTIAGSMAWADLILVSDCSKYLRELEGFRNRGFPIFGPNLEVASWELDRTRGVEILEQCGIECLPDVRFTNFDQAIAYQRAHMDERFVCKPCADVAKDLSYVSKSAKDMLFMLEYWKRTVKKKCPFIFQQFCAGIEVAVGGWVGRNGFSAHFLENFEHKKLMNDEKGPNTGEQGTVIKYVTADESKLARELLLPLEAELIRRGFTGYIDVAVMCGTEGDRKGKLNPLEFTSRKGWPLFNIQQILHPDVVNWMKDLVDGHDTFKPDPDIATGVVLSMPDFPYCKAPLEKTDGFPVWGTEKIRYNFHPVNMRLGDGIDDKGKKIQMLVTVDPYVAVITGAGKTISQSAQKAYKNLESIEMPNSPIYRTDIGKKLEKSLPILQKYGYCTSWIY
jgi:phosphoribosylamine--glycine ligase